MRRGDDPTASSLRFRLSGLPVSVGLFVDMGPKQPALDLDAYGVAIFLAPVADNLMLLVTVHRIGEIAAVAAFPVPAPAADHIRGQERRGAGAAYCGGDGQCHGRESSSHFRSSLDSVLRSFSKASRLHDDPIYIRATVRMNE